MSFREINVTNYIGVMSPQALSLAVNSYGVHFAANASGASSIGVIKAAIPQKKARIIVRASEAYASGESLVISLRYENAAGAQVSVALGTLNDTNITGAGEFEVASGIDTGDLGPGSVLEAVRVYVAGGGPADPRISITIELF